MFTSFCDEKHMISLNAKCCANAYIMFLERLHVFYMCSETFIHIKNQTLNKQLIFDIFNMNCQLSDKYTLFDMTLCEALVVI